MPVPSLFYKVLYNDDPYKTISEPGVKGIND